MTEPTPPLGAKSDYPNEYAPELLYPIARSVARENNGIGTDLPFHGTDVWNAWELTWLGPNNRPATGTVEILVPVRSPNLIESKSLKLYLNSFAMTPFDSINAVADRIAADLSARAGCTVDVTVRTPADHHHHALTELPGVCLDDLPVRCDAWHVDSSLLQTGSGEIVAETLHTHLLRSLCPVTGQPDLGSLLLRYEGPHIDTEQLLRYVVSFREHNDFHEACIERMFVDILARCSPLKLSLYARYQRRGGIDINPFRSNFEEYPGNLRLWRQ